jgi:hypothetical protein
MGSGGTGAAGNASAKSAWTWLQRAAALCLRVMARAWDVMVVFFDIVCYCLFFMGHFYAFYVWNKCCIA